MPRIALCDEAPRVLLCAKGEAEATRLAEELRLLGFEVETENARSPVCTNPRDDITTVAVSKGVHVVTEPGGGRSVLVSAADESPNAFALRTAEHLRGRLLPTGTGAAPHAPPPPYQLAIHLGPALALATYGGPAFAVVGDVTYFWGRVGFGPYAFATLTSTPWAKERAQFAQRQTTFGGQARFVLHRATNPGLELHGLVNVGARLQRLEAIKGAAAGVFAETACAFAFGAAFEVLYSPSDWLAFGGQTGVQLGVPLAWPASVDTLDNPAQRALENVADESSVDGALVVAVLASFHF